MRKKTWENQKRKDVMKSQRIFKLHNKSLKHVYLQGRIDRIDSIIQQLFFSIQQLVVSKVSLHHQYRILVCFKFCFDIYWFLSLFVPFEFYL